MLFGGRVNHHAFTSQHRSQPFGCPGAFAGVVDPCKRLQGDGSAVAFLGMQPRPTRPLLVGIAYAFQQVEHLSPEAWDVALDYVATERELIDCRAAA